MGRLASIGASRFVRYSPLAASDPNGPARLELFVARTGIAGMYEGIPQPWRAP